MPAANAGGVTASALPVLDSHAIFSAALYGFAKPSKSCPSITTALSVARKVVLGAFVRSVQQYCAPQNGWSVTQTRRNDPQWITRIRAQCDFSVLELYTTLF